MKYGRRDEAFSCLERFKARYKLSQVMWVELRNLAHTLTHFFKAEISRIAYPGKIVLWDGMPLWAKKEYFKWLNYLWGKEIQALGEEGSKLPKTINGYYFEEDHMVWIFKREEKREPTGGEEEWMADIRNEIELRYGKREQTVGDLAELQLRPEAVSYGGGHGPRVSYDPVRDL